MSENAGRMLVGAGLISQDDLVAALEARRLQGGTIGLHLVTQGAIAPDALAEFFHHRLMVPRVSPRELARIRHDALNRLPADMAAEFRVIPVDADNEGNLTLAMADPSDTHAVDEVAFFTGAFVVRAVATEGEISEALARYYGVEAPALPPPPSTRTLRGIDPLGATMRLDHAEQAPPLPAAGSLDEVGVLLLTKVKRSAEAPGSSVPPSVPQPEAAAQGGDEPNSEEIAEAPVLLLTPKQRPRRRTLTGIALPDVLKEDGSVASQPLPRQAAPSPELGLESEPDADLRRYLESGIVPAADPGPEYGTEPRVPASLPFPEEAAAEMAVPEQEQLPAYAELPAPPAPQPRRSNTTTKPRLPLPPTAADLALRLPGGDLPVPPRPEKPDEPPPTARSSRESSSDLQPRRGETQPRLPLPPAAADLALNDFVPAFRAAPNRDAITELLLDFLAPYCHRSALFIVKKGFLSAAALRGDGVRVEAARASSLLLDEPSIFRDVAASRLPYRGPIDNEAGWAFVRLAMGAVPAEASLWPVLVQSKVIAILYGESSVELPERAIEAAVREAGAAFERLLLERKK